MLGFEISGVNYQLGKNENSEASDLQTLIHEFHWLPCAIGFVLLLSDMESFTSAAYSLAHKVP